MSNYNSQLRYRSGMLVCHCEEDPLPPVHYRSRQPRTRGRGFFRCAKAQRCSFFAWSGIDDVTVAGPHASDEPPILPPDLVTAPHPTSQSPPPYSNASQVETHEGVSVRRLEADNLALRAELRSLQAKLSQCEDDLGHAKEKHDSFIARLGGLLAAV